MISWLTEPWSLVLMRHAFLAITLVGLICGVVGVFVILRGLAFLGDALAHAIFPGVVIAFILGGNFLIWALVAAIIVSFGIGLVSQSAKLSNDTAIGVIFAGGFALGVTLLSTQASYARDLNGFLFGSLLGVSRNDLKLTAIVGAVVLLVVAWFRREFTSIAFDRTFAQSSGINLWAFDQLFLIALAMAIVISLQTVGNVLVLAMLVTPAATARMLTDRLPVMVTISAAIGMASGITGLYVSYYRDVPSGAAVVLVATCVFLLVFLFAPSSGLITSRVRRQLHHGHPERDQFGDDLLPTSD
jgi:ABC-type Mn2+/Zn2+ transport system permease subunit